MRTIILFLILMTLLGIWREFIRFTRDYEFVNNITHCSDYKGDGIKPLGCQK